MYIYIYTYHYNLTPNFPSRIPWFSWCPVSQAVTCAILAPAGPQRSRTGLGFDVDITPIMWVKQ